MKVGTSCLVGGLLLLSFAASSIHGLGFFLAPGDKKCIELELRTNQLVKGSYTLDVQDGHFIDVDISDSAKNKLFAASKDYDITGKIGFSTVVDGIHTLCFANKVKDGIGLQGAQAKISFDVVWGAQAYDFQEAARIEHLEPIEAGLRKAENIVKDMTAEILYQREREATHRDTNEAINFKVPLFSIFSVVTLLSTSTWQIYHLRKFFKKQRMGW